MIGWIQGRNQRGGGLKGLELPIQKSSPPSPQMKWHFVQGFMESWLLSPDQPSPEPSWAPLPPLILKSLAYAPGWIIEFQNKSVKRTWTSLDSLVTFSIFKKKLYRET